MTSGVSTRQKQTKYTHTPKRPVSRALGWWWLFGGGVAMETVYKSYFPPGACTNKYRKVFERMLESEKALQELFLEKSIFYYS